MAHKALILAFGFLLVSFLSAQTDAAQTIRSVVMNETCPSAERSHIREKLNREVQQFIDEYVQSLGRPKGTNQ